MSGDHADVVHDRVAWVAADRLFRERPLERRYSFLQPDGKFEKVGERGGVRRKHVVIANAVDPSARALTIGASRTPEPGEAGGPAVILSWTAAAP